MKLVPLPQSPEFAAALDRLGQPMARHAEGGVTWQAALRRLGQFGAVPVVSRGPLGTSADRLDWLARRRGAMLLEAEDLPAPALRSAGFWPLVTPASLAILPLGPVPAMRAGLHQKWRNRLVRAETAAFEIREGPLMQGHWLMRAEARQARARGYRGLPERVLNAFAAANPGKTRVFEARLGAQPIAGVLVLRHGAMATFQTGHATQDGRRLNATNRLLWCAMTWLGAQGHAALDLGMVNTDDAPGLARFKLGTSARVHRLSGSWLRVPGLGALARRLPPVFMP